jgi:alpha-pyrone synthase
MNPISAYLNRIGTAVPTREAHQEFVDTLDWWVSDSALVDKLRVISRRSGIARRYTVLADPIGLPGSGAFYQPGHFPTTTRRMQVYQHEAPILACRAAQALQSQGVDLASITHLLITSCTGFYAPGLDVDLIRSLRLPTGVHRTIIGFMGCYAGITGLRTASEIVRAHPEARVLMVNLELCTLHLQENAPMDQMVASMLFSDGCAASLISARPEGFRLDHFRSILSLPDANKMSWLVADQGFAMTLDPEIPDRIRDFLTRDPDLFSRAQSDPASLWAIHPGGRAILDAVRTACSLTTEQMSPARHVLSQYGNMSSASIMFVLERLLRHTPPGSLRPGAAAAFGPGLTVETMEFTQVTRPRLTPTPQLSVGRLTEPTITEPAPH